MFTYHHQLRVRYAETDQMGYVHHGNYAAYYEEARTEALRSTGITYKQLEESGVMMPVYENFGKFLRPARYDDVLTIKVMLKKKPSVKITFEYEIFNESSILIHTGYTTLVFVDRNTAKPCAIPPMLQSVFMRYFDGE
jgi:acyl-CoA thioester hydrolase